MTTLDQVFKNPHKYSYKIDLQNGESAMLRPLMPGDAVKLGEFLCEFDDETRKFYTYESFDFKMAQSLCLDINKYDKLRYILELTSTKEIIGEFEFSMDLTYGDIERYKGYGYNFEPERVCRYGPVVAVAYRKQGIGQRVFEYMKEIAAEFAKKQIILFGGVYADNGNAIKFYTKLSFEKAGDFINDDGVECLDMIFNNTKKLNRK